jgi:hypothetical protein
MSCSSTNYGYSVDYIPQFQVRIWMRSREDQYAKQDSLALFLAIERAQDTYFSDHKVDITSIYSTSTLSMKIFRQKFLKLPIPILKHSEDLYIRDSYLGGATDYYKAYGENLHYYDVNSLYPFVMLNDMPLNIETKYKDMSNMLLKDFFGFAVAEITSPSAADNIINPLIPYKFNDKTIYPKGSWTGTYFSEELKAAVSYGYKVKLISGYSFSKVKLFNEYINYFYDIKKKI